MQTYSASPVWIGGSTRTERVKKRGCLFYTGFSTFFVSRRTAHAQLFSKNAYCTCRGLESLTSISYFVDSVLMVPVTTMTTAMVTCFADQPIIRTVYRK